MSNNQRIRQILVIIATVGLILVNYLAATGRVGGVTPDYVSNKYPTLITPAGYAFSIWGLIYLGLAAFSVFQALPSNTARFANIRSPYILSCAANCAWIFLWHNEQILPSLAVMFILLGTLVFINLSLLKTETRAEYLLTRLPFNTYLGWVTLATVLNFTIALIYLGVKTTDSVGTVSACSLIAAVTILGVIIRRNLAAASYPLVIAWGLTAIAVKQSGQTLITAFAAAGVIVLLFSALSGFLTANKTAR